jgi:steroid Delta-isomerase
MSERLDALAQFFTTLSQESLPQLRDFYAADAFFKDPFNEVQKVADIEHIFSEMFVSLHAPKFVIHSQIAQGNEAFLIWDFHFRIKKYQPNLEQKIRGSSHLKFDEQGRVNYHRDYWDAAEELYEKLPLIGIIMRFMKRRVG